MRHLVSWVVAGAVLLCAVVSAATAPKPTHAFPVPYGDFLGLTIPEGLIVESREEEMGLLLVELRPEDQSYEILISTLPTAMRHMPRPEVEAGVEASLLVIAAEALSHAADAETNPTETEIPAGSMRYFRLMDAREVLPDGYYRYTLFGLAEVKELWLLFMLGTNDAGMEAQDLTLGIIRSVTYEEAPGASLVKPAGHAAITQDHELRLAGRDWALHIDLPGYDVRLEDREWPMFRAAHPETGMVVTGYLWEQATPATSLECREQIFSDRLVGPGKKADIRRSKLGEVALGEFTIRGRGGRRDRPRHVYAYLASPGGDCAEVHMSKERYTRGDGPKFSAILRGIRVVEDASPAAGSE